MAFPPQSPQRSLLPHDLHLHLCKLKKALTCSICYQLMQKSACLHCNHHFCMSCLLQSMGEMSACPKCKHPAATRQARFAPEMDTLVQIYQSLESSVGLASGFHDNATPVVANSEDSQLDKLLENKNLAFNVKIEEDCLSPSAMKRQRRHENREKVTMDETEADSRKRDASSVEVPCRGILPASKRIQLACPPPPTERNDLDRINTTSNMHPVLDIASMNADVNSSLGRQKEPIFAHATIGGQARAKGQPLSPYEDKVSLPTDLQESEFLYNDQPNVCASALGKRAASHSKGLEQERMNVESSLQGPCGAQSQETETQLGNAQGQHVEKSVVHDANQADQDTDQVTCAFCHTSDSQVAGPIIHYKNGVPVSGSKRSSKTISVHKNCAEWAPGVYYEDDVAKSIPQEIARGQKIKCHVCGLRGAVLGCYVKRCRKSFHYPCAHTLSCRWDSGNFLVFCPEHVASRFPDEGAKGSRSKPISEVNSSHKEEKASQTLFVNEYRIQSNADTVEKFTLRNNVDTLTLQKNVAPVETFTPVHPAETRVCKEEPLRKWPASKWVLCSSGLSPKANELLATFVSYTGLTYEKMWSPSVTHLIAGTDEVGAARRTLKYLMANLEGKWILKVDWLSACMAADRYVGEEPYEVNLDIHGMIGGPRRARGMAIAKVHRLFEGLRFYFVGEYVAAYRADLQALVIAAGGMVLSRVPDASERDVTSCTVLIYSKDMYPDTSVLHREELNKSRYLEAKSLAGVVGAKVAGHTWILDSVASYDLQPFE